MASGSINLTSNQPNYVSGRIDWQSYTNIQGNYSTVSVQVYVILNRYGIQGTGSGQFKVNNSTVANFSPYVNVAYGGYGTIQVFSKNDIIVNHNENGDATVNLGCEMSFSFAGISSISGNQTVSMDHIDRYPYFTKLKVENTTLNTATIRWEANDQISEITYNVNGGNAINGAYPTFTIEDLEPNTTYDVKVNIKRRTNGLWASENISVTTKDIARILELNDMDIEATQNVIYKINTKVEGTIKFEAYIGAGTDFKIFEKDLSINEKSFEFKLDQTKKNLIYTNQILQNYQDINCKLITTTNNKVYEDTKTIKLTFSGVDPQLYSFTFKEDNPICENLMGANSNTFIQKYSDISLILSNIDYKLTKYPSPSAFQSYLSKVIASGGDAYTEENYPERPVNEFKINLGSINSNAGSGRGNIDIKMTIFDTRGNSASKMQGAGFILYNDIKINNFTAERKKLVSTIVNINLKGIVDLVNFTKVKNSLKKLEYRKRRTNEEYLDTWTSILNSATIDNQTGEFTLKNKEISGFTLGYEYELQIRAKDELSESIITIVVNSGEPLICVNKTRKVTGFGKIPDRNLPKGSIDVSGTVNANNMTINEENIGDYIYNQIYNIIYNNIYNNIKSELQPVELWTGKLMGKNNISISNLSSYKYLEIFIEAYGMRGNFKIDLTTPTTVNSNTATPLGSYAGTGFAGLDSASNASSGSVQIYKCNAYVNSSKTRLYITHFTRTSDSQFRDNNSEYFVYKVIGYKN